MFPQERYDELVRIFYEVLTCSGDPNLKREGLRETPERAAKAFMFHTSGYLKDPADVLKTFEDGSENYDGMVFQGEIPFFSKCEHHLETFYGHVHIGYIPKNKVIGLSKFGRVVEIYARRLQVQERLTTQVANCLFDALSPEGLGVVIEARHMCIECRGIEKVGSVTRTHSLLGSFRNDPSVRSEFLSMVGRSKNIGK